MRGAKRVLELVPGVVLLLSALSAPASAVLYGTLPVGSTDTDLVTIDPATGAASVVGATGFPQVWGLASRPSDAALFGAVGVASADQGAVVIIDPVTGAGTAVGTASGIAVAALVFTAGGTLYASCAEFSPTNPDTLCAIDQSNGAVSQVGTGFDALNQTIYIDSLAVNTGGTLYGASRSTSAGGTSLYTVNVSTGQATLVAKICGPTACGSGGTQLSTGVVGLAFVNGTLYGSTSDGRIVTVDPTTAVYTVVGPIGATGAVQDLTVINVPDTATPTATNTLIPTLTFTPTPTATATPTPPPCSLPMSTNACVPGGGLKSTDCFMEWLFTPALLRGAGGTPTPNTTRSGLPKNRFICYEGDPRCDLDANLGNNSCTLPVSLCINNTDPRLTSCTPADVFSVAVRAPNPLRTLTGADQTNLQTLEQTANAAPPAGLGVNVVEGSTVTRFGLDNATPNACMGPMGIVVPLHVSATGRVSTGRKTLSVRVRATSGQSDTDALHLQCRKSTCGDGVIQLDHETCDDGNRINGDGCDQGCQVEPGFSCSGQPSHCVSLTPTSTATPVSTATPSNSPTPSPTSTNTSALPSATPTDTATPPDTATPTNTGTVTETGTPTDTPTETPVPPTPTPTATLGPPLGSRTFTLSSNSGFFSSFLPTSKVGTPQGSMVLVAGGEDGNGHAAVTVTGPDFITTVISAGGVTLCTKIESCTGDLYCNGGTNVDASETLDSLKTGLTCVENGTNNCPNAPSSVCCSNACEGVGVGSGNPTIGALGIHATNSGVGALSLTCMQRSVSVNATSGVNCSIQDYSTAADTPEIYTSASNTAIVTNHCAGTLSSNNATTVPMFTKTGQAFSCTNWTSSTGPGSLSFSIPTEQPTTLFAGDGAQAGVFAGN